MGDDWRESFTRELLEELASLEADVVEAAAEYESARLVYGLFKARKEASDKYIATLPTELREALAPTEEAGRA